MAHRWYIVQAYSNFEKHVQKAIEREAEEKGLSDLFEEILVPTESFVEVRKGRKIESERKFFPGYVLVKVDLTDQVQEGVDAPRPLITFEIGENVKVIDGSFASFNGSVESIDEEHARLNVLINIFGRPTPVELEYSQVEKT